MVLERSLQLFLVVQCASMQLPKINNETAALQFLIDHDETFGILWNLFYKSAWEYFTNVTEENQKDMNDKSVRLSNFDKEAAGFAEMFDYETFTHTTLKRQFIKIIERPGLYATNDSDLLEKVTNTQRGIRNLHGKAMYCLPRQNCLNRAGLQQVMEKSRFYDELSTVWQGWHDVAGQSVKEQFTQLTQVMNKAVQYSGFSDIGDWWGSLYEMPYFENDITHLFQDLEPLYKELHAYIRKRLLWKYGREVFPLSGHIPVHLLGSLGGGNIENIYKLLEPFPNASVDITKKMIEKGYNVSLMYRLAEDFYRSLGMEPLTKEFWEKSMFLKPTDRNVFCQPSSWDFGDGKDYRIKACTHVDEKNLIMVYREVGHIVYYQSYKRQNTMFRNAANPGFLDGFANLAALSLMTPEYLSKIALTDSDSHDSESEINYLLKLALEKVAFLPYAYAIDRWRWNVFRGQISPSEYNKKWWDIRCRYQGVSPPVKRTDEDFDPGALYNVAANIPIIKHFISVIVQFQCHAALCEAVGHKGDLHRCNLYGSKTAGYFIKKALRLGSSKPWQKVMRIITRRKQMSVKPLLKFFSPLLSWLRDQNREENMGWARSCPSVIPQPETSAPLDHPNKYIRYFYLVPPIE